MDELKIEYLSPNELTPYENNTRKHAPDDIEQIKKSILEDGFNDPIGIWGKQNIIVEGHGRQIAAIELHLEKVPVIRLDHMTDAQRRDYAIRHNRTAELSAWDFTALEEEIAALEIEGHDFSGLDFTFDSTAGGTFEDFFTAVPVQNQQEAQDESKQSRSESKPELIRCPHCGEWFTP
jgi:ParB-like chromosome segregation protein Spo0J